MSRPHRRSRSGLRRELRTRDAFLSRVSAGLSARVRAFDTDPASALEALQGFARELAIIAGDHEARAPRRATLDVGLHVHQIIEELQRAHAVTARSGPTIQVERTGALMASVDGDLVAIMLAEILSNACKYSLGRPIRVLVEGETDHVRIVVEDEGAGFIRTPGLGKRFVRGAGSEKVRGFGVGLWLTQTLAAEHGGALHFTPRTGGGTRAIMTLRRQAP